jgi:DNA polymerase I-like protein with 3'-5' exonuclease and polymerase domains
MEFIEVKTEEQAHELVKIMPDIIAVDTEYIPGNPRTTQLTSVIVADSDRAWICSPLLLPILSPAIRTRKLIFLQDYNHCDTIILLKHGCDLRQTNCHNLIDMHHLLDENADHSLKTRVLETFQDDYKVRLKGQFDNLEYQGKDGIYTYRLGMQDMNKLEPSGLAELHFNVKCLSRTLLETELNGIHVDTELLQNTYITMQTEINEFLPKLREEFKNEVEVWELTEWDQQISKRKSDAGRLRVPRPDFNFDSDRQINWLVYTALECPIINKTKAGNPSTDTETIQTLSEGQERLKLLVEYKNIKSVFSTFVEGMLERVENGRIYPSFNVSGTATGRLSHSNPNMGNLPKTGIIRNFFIPDSGMVFIGADYSQLEVVIEANLTDDPNLLKIINEGASKHDITAQGLNIPRDQAKTLNFALQYGAGAGKVSQILGISKTAAEDVFNRYWKLYSGIQTLKEKVNKEIEETGQITNIAGRVRRFPKTNNKFEVYKQQRQAYNFLIQGLAAECCNRAFTQYGGLWSVHDEIIAQCKPEDAEREKFRLVKIMEEQSVTFNFKYPLKAVAYGPLTKWGKT